MTGLPVGSVLSILSTLRTKYSQLKEASEMCKRLHTRLESTITELKKIESPTREDEDLLQQFEDLINDYAATVEKYACERNFFKRISKTKKMTADILIYNERRQDIMELIALKTSVMVEDWRKEYREDVVAFYNLISKTLGEEQFSEEAKKNKQNLKEMAFVMKRDIADPESPEDNIPPLDNALSKIVTIVESILNQKLQKPPTWLIADDEVTRLGSRIDDKRSTDIFVGEWQGVEVAVKVFKLAGDNPIFDKHFNVWRSLLHPHVAQLYGAGCTDKGAPFFVYEYASRQSLDRCRNELTLKEVWHILHQAALGLSYLHKNRFVHGNLSCSKLLVNSQGKAKLFGFEASYARVNDKSNSKKVSSREQLKAPECLGINADGVFHGKVSSPRFESDVYMLGLTIIEAITKTVPFDGKSSDDICELKRDQLSKPEDLSDEVWSLVSQMCLRDPYQRVSLAKVTQQLEKFALM